MYRLFNPRFREGQIIYNKVAEIYKKSRRRPYITPIILLVIKLYAERFNLVEYFNGLIEWDQSQWKISPGILALSLIYVCFISEDGHVPLYKIPDRLQGLDLTILFGFPFEPEDFNDDIYARFLDRLGKLGEKNILYDLITQIYCIFDMPKSDMLHSDTTSHIMYGLYKECDKDGYEGLRINKGYSKDNDRKHKQLLSGIIVDGNGVLKKAKALDGNKSDAVWNTDSIEELQNQLGDDIDQVIYVADSKLVTIPNLRTINKHVKKLRFISLVPSSFYKKISSKIRKEAYERDHFEYVGACCENTEAKDRAKYSISRTPSEVEGLTYRFLVCISSALKHSSEEKINAKRSDIVSAAEDIFSKPFACIPDAKSAISRFQKSGKNALYQVVFEIVPIENEKMYRGRKPKNHRPVLMVTEFHVRVKEVIPVIERIEQLIRREESFVLITNIPETELSDREVLCKYKSQGVVERTIRRLKRPIMMSPLFLKIIRRINALTSLVYIALMFQSIMQAMARHRAKLLGELPKIKYAKRNLKNPTYELLICLLDPFEIVSTREYQEVSCLVPELNDHLMLFLYLVDAEAC